MEVIVQQWDEGSVSEVVFDRQYMLGVSQTEYTFARSAQADNLLIITTDVPEGWDFYNDSPEWLTVTGRTYNAPGGKDDLLFDIDANPGPDQRTALLTVTAGRMNIVVKIIQTTDDKYTIEVTDENDAAWSEITFTSYGTVLTAQSKTAILNWTPAGEDCTVAYTALANSGLRFDILPNPFLATPISGGTQTYNICPDEFTDVELDTDPYMEKTSRVDFSVGSGLDLIIESLGLRHIHYDLFAAAADSYPLDGERYSFTLSTNADWTVSASGNTDLATLVATSGQPNTAGAEFYFDMSDDESLAGSPLILTFTYTGIDGRSATKVVEINGEPARGLKDAGDANCYILEPGGDGIEIPLAWANGSPYGERIGANDDVTIKVIWLDTDRGIAANSVISGYKLSGNGASGKIEVYPGTQQGNALIGAYVSGEIKWSWHIWVTDYNFDSGYTTIESRKWMNINLGAIIDTPGDVNSFGLFYQWGRKDPFAPVVSLSDFSQRALWDESGTPVVHSFENTTQLDNIEYAIGYPVTFFRGVSGNDYDWSTSQYSNKNNYLWKDATTGGKTHYDPCPYGWRTAYRTDGGVDNPMNQLGWVGTYESTQGYTISNMYWQMCGVLYYDGNYQPATSGTGVQGYYWAGSAIDNGQYGHLMQLFSYGIGVDNGSYRAIGMNVRCIEER